LEKLKIDSALIYKETKIDYALPKFGKRKEKANKETENSLMLTLFNIRIDKRIAT